MNDYSTVYPIGNGKVAVYEDGIQIRDMFGPYYSSPTFVRMSLTGSRTVQSVRHRGSAVREHTIFENGRSAGAVTDYTDAGKPVFYRRIVCTVPLEFAVRLNEGVRCTRTGRNHWLCEEKNGHVFAQLYPIPQPLYAGFEADDACEMTLGQPELDPDTASYSFEDGPDRTDVGRFWRWSRYEKDFLVLRCPAGEHLIRVAFGSDWREVDSLQSEPPATPEACLDWWRAQLAQAQFPALPADPDREYHLSELAENIAVMLICQQGRDASTISGYMHRMGYIRDQYGAFRGFLKLGFVQRARQIIEFNYRVFRRYGVLHTAQAIGYDGVFHCHENDDVELTGYVILEVFDYLEKTGDSSFAASVFPMLKWALEAQIGALSNDMLPFNGDETYIAGGLLPRSAICDGSAETTLQFIVSADRLLDFGRKAQLFSPAEYRRCREIADRVRQNYAGNFTRDGVFWANNPDRQPIAERPLFRHGVCERCGQFTWLKKDVNGRYQCPACFETPLPLAEKKRFLLPSVSLNTAFIGGLGYTRSETVLRAAETIADSFLDTGEIRSSPVSPLSVGYEFGLLLYTLTAFKSEKARPIFAGILQALDRDGTWGEYYRGRRCVSARCRPWESGINVEAILYYLETFYKGDPT